MPPPENKTPFKSMNIKSALLAAANRKRKATSPILSVKHIKNIEDSKRIKDTSDDEIQIITEDSDIAAIGDCKENTDLNVVKSELTTPVVEKLSPSSNNMQKDCVKSDTLLNSELSACDRSFVESSDELNSSNLNDSINALHSNELSENGGIQSKSEADAPSSKKRTKNESTLKSPSETNQNVSNSKKKRKMTAEQAKKRSEVREEKQKELLAKKRLLDAQKLQKKLEKEQMRIQKEIERQEKENERKEKERLKQEKERLKQEKKEQEERERQQKLKEKEDQKKIRQMQQEMKLEEKKKREELKLKREEEMKKAEEEKQKAKLEKEQKEKEKLERNKAAFKKFFVASNKSVTAPVVPQVVEKEGAFKPFQVSDDMTLAPVVPPVAQERFNKDKLNHDLELQDSQELYLQILKSGKYKDVRLRKRLRKQRACEDVIVIDNIEPELFLKAKLLQFSENVRPPYWGTWRKQSTKVRPRNPFGQEDIFDYTVDSDDEWDEGGPGESLSGTENEIESEDDYEVDNEFFVPHGYLSAEEEKEDDEVENDPEKQKAKLKLKQQEFELERKMKTTELKPLILGCYIETLPEFQDLGLCTFLQAYAGEMVSDSPILTCFTVKKLLAESKLLSNSSSPVASSASVKKKKFPEEAMPHLIRLVHGNTNSRDTMVKEFQSFWREYCSVTSEDAERTNKKPAAPPKDNIPNQEPNSETPLAESKNLSKRQLYILIKKIATYSKSSHPAVKKSCWYVHNDIREKYGLQDAPIPNEWNYQCPREEGEASASPVTKLNCASIKEFLIP